MNTTTDILFSQDTAQTDLKIKIIGIGGAGTNAVDGLKLDNLGDVRLAAINTDAQALNQSPISEKLVIGRSVTRGLGAGGEVEIGKAAAESDRDGIARLIGDVDLIIMVVGLGGGTGSAAAAVVAEVAAKTNALVLAFATLPFSFEGARRKRIAEESVGELRQLVHGLIPLPNDVLLQEGEEDTSVLNAFAVADRWIGRGVNSLCAMLLKTGLINQDFSSLRSVFQDRGGKTIFGTGTASGGDYVKDALEELFICPLLHLGDRPAQLDRILVNVIGGADLGIAKVNEIMTQVTKRFGSREDIVFGAVIDEGRSQSLELCILGKAEMDTFVLPDAADPVATKSKRAVSTGLGLETEISLDTRAPRPVHTSKLRKKLPDANQDEFTFVDNEDQRGYFDKTDRNDYNDEDLDVPTFMRRGIKIKIK
ncbi:cell division protein FtsZ [Coraliomargarita sp. SDUM461004]|uniref:Cell division protein FtsZ n=1 Tax=Thalassobacterium sedimentorum TaxID=3041258 RepID=A0ABU1ALT4_9BACT|nr:cell division protein FtsZ [Coraliomargarita sp. SDUM461004]MDQ8195746.1 cell division protein FtsZ [Coraliomargarita sp. SDUM461004]